MIAAYFIGDSIAGVPYPAYPWVAATRLGWTATVDQVGGSGFLQDGLGSRYRTRLPTCVAAAPNVVVVQGSGNDVWSNLPDLTTEIGLFFAALRAGLPTATVYATAPWMYGGAGIGTSKIAMGLVIASNVQAIGGRYIDWLTVPWISGTGYVGAENGSGNSDIYIRADGVHPTSPGGGSAYIGTRLAFAIRPPSTGLAGSF